MQINTRSGPISIGLDAPSQIRDQRARLYDSVDLLRGEIKALDFEHAEKSHRKHQRAVAKIKRFEQTVADIVVDLERVSSACEQAALSINGKSKDTSWTASLPANVTDSALFLREFRTAHPKEAAQAADALTAHAKALQDVALQIYSSAEKSLAVLPGLEAKAQYALARKQAAHREAEALEALTAPDGLYTHAQKAAAAFEARKAEGRFDWRYDEAHRLYARALDRLAGVEFAFNSEQRETLEHIETNYVKAMSDFRKTAGRPEKSYSLEAENV